MSSSFSERSVVVPTAFLGALRAAVESQMARPAAASPIDAIRDVGYTTGQALFLQFGAWLRERGDAPPEALPQDRFMLLVDAFLTERGWGGLTALPLSDAVLALDSSDWAEGMGGGTGCHLSTGLLAGFFGSLSDEPLAVLEVECRAAGAGRCRFLLGSLDVLGAVHDGITRGQPYLAAVAALG